MCLQEMSKMDKIGSPRKWNKDYSFGDIDYKKVVRRIIENKKHWFGNDKPNISERRIINLIEKYVRISKVKR